MSISTPPDLGPVTVRLHESFRLQSGSELEISYDGSRPPHELFTGLTAIGWMGAAPSSPPATAIDWSRPDPVAGTRHSVRPHLAVTTAHLDGSARFREVALEQTRALLARHGLLDEPKRDGAELNRPAPIDRSGPVGTLEVTVDAAMAETVRRAAERVGSVIDDRGDVFVTETVYRGQRNTAELIVRCLTIELPDEQRDPFIASLTGLGVRRIA